MKKPAIRALTCLIAFVGVWPLEAQQTTVDTVHSQYLLAADKSVHLCHYREIVYTSILINNNSL